MFVNLLGVKTRADFNLITRKLCDNQCGSQLTNFFLFSVLSLPFEGKKTFQGFVAFAYVEVFLCFEMDNMKHLTGISEISQFYVGKSIFVTGATGM